MEGLNWQTIQLPLAMGMNKGAVDSRAMQPPELTSAIDVQFDEQGGLQTRHPYADMGINITPAGFMTDMRRVVRNGDELLCFTKDAVYSWNAQLGRWVSKGTHLAVEMDEHSRFVSTGDQVDCDRAELNNTIVYAWVDGSSVYVAAMDKTTGNVIMSPTAMTTNAPTRPRLVALSTKILLFTYQTSGTVGLVVRALDPSAVSTGVASAATSVLVSGANTYYDVVRIASTDTAAFAIRRNPTTSYEVGTVSAGLTVTTTTKARKAEGPIAVSATPDGTSLQVVRCYDNGGSTVRFDGDLVTASTLVDTYTNTQLSIESSYTLSAVRHIAAAHRSTQDSSAYRCYVWFHLQSAPGNIRMLWVDTSNNVGTVSTFMKQIGVELASRAFSHDGRVYVWMVFAGASVTTFRGATVQLQNTYFLFRDDGFLVAKAAYQRAGGYTQSASLLPGVVLTSGSTTYSWCGVERRVVPTGTGSSYSDRGPRDITFTFDSDAARRCVRLGATLYVACGEGLLQYDGSQIVEVGFHNYPWVYTASAAPGAGNVENGDYAIKPTFRWDSSAGEVDRSTTASTLLETMGGGPGIITIADMPPLSITHKTRIAVEIWRTLKNPVDDAPFYLVTSSDPADTSNPNRYIEVDNTLSTLPSFDDALDDDAVGDLGTHPENGGNLENLTPPAAKIVIASENRLFLGAIAGDPDRVWYSKQRNVGEVAAFHDTLVIPIPQPGGEMTGLALLQETLVVFRETAIYLVPGDGFDNAANGQNYGPARALSLDVGAVNQESIAVTERGVVFKSSKGWHLLGRGLDLAYIGEKIAEYDDEEPLAVNVVEAQHQVRVLTASRMLVLDTRANQWAEWTIDDGVHACIWNGVHIYLSSADGPMEQQADFTGVDYGMDVETAWIKFNDLQGFARLRRLLVLGEYRSNHTLRIRLARDYQTTYFQDKTWVVSPTTVGGSLQVKHGPSIQQMQAVKVRITATNDVAGEAATAGGSRVRDADTFVIQIDAVAVGTSYNGKSLQLVADGTGTGSFTDGAAAVFHYQSGVTTVADLIVATATATYFRVTGSGTINHTETYTLAGGVNASSGSPTGEALKLTGLGLEVGIKRGLRNNLPAAQRQ